MEALETGRQQLRRTRNSSEGNFILPTKTNRAIKIVAPSVKTSGEVPASASETNEAARSHHASHDARSADATRSIQSQHPCKPKVLDECSGRTTQPATEQAAKRGTSRESLVPSSIPNSPSTQHDGGLDATQITRAARTAVDSELDIYAHSYIPMWQRAINESPAIQRPCCPLSTIDYDTYTNSFAGSGILSKVPPISLSPIHPVPYRIYSRPEDLLPQQYGDYFSDALQNEIAAQFEELNTFSMYHVAFDVEDTGQQLYGFTIPGLREHSPRVDLGDVVKIRPLTVTPQQQHLFNRAGTQDLTPEFSGFEFDAIVWRIYRPQELIVLRMDGFMPNLYRTCNIIFAIQEHRCTALWRSIYLTECSLRSARDRSSPWLRQMLFPDPKYAKLQSSLSRGDFDLVWFDSQMNFEQKKAVDAVVTANYGCLPYLISGPPGTGKTKTIVETALQLLQSEPAGLAPHLLVCAPSDPAADTIVTRLSAHLDPHLMLRLNSWTRSFAEVPETILPYTYAENNLFSLPDFETMMSYQVVVTTCRDADMLVQARLTNESLMHLAQKTLSAVAPQLSKSLNPKQFIHWTALLLDEAAQAIEPEALIPLSVIDPAFSMAATGSISTEWSHSVPQVVMAGDEYQLGPRLSLKLTSPLATSLFARLFARPLYSTHPLSRANGSPALTSAMLPILRPPFTNLMRNYRSHPAILTVPSVLFYADSLIAECNTLSDVVQTWPGWQEADAFGGRRSVAVGNSDPGDAGWGNDRDENLSCWPVLFVNNSGEDALESILAGRRAGGLFNDREASVALRIVQSLLRHRTPGPPTERAWGGLPSMQVNGYASEAMTNNDSIQPGEIVVMSPFRAQVNCLRKAFREAGLYGVSIGPLEAFQGLESRIVILCTTRTRLGTVDNGRDRFVREDQSKGLGVIGEQKKFNVAITRAKEGLIVIGNKGCLTCTEDEAWVEFLAFCERNERDRSARKLSPQLPVSYTPRQGRLERALRQKDNLRRKRREGGYGDDYLTGSPLTGFGHPNQHESSKNRLKGNMPSLDEDMFQDGLRIADEMSYDADNSLMYGANSEAIGAGGNHEKTPDSIKNARQLSARFAKPGLGRGDTLRPTTPQGNEESFTTYIPRTVKAAGAHTETLPDMSNTPSSTSAGARSGCANTPTPLNREAPNSGAASGSFHVPVATNTGERVGRAIEHRGPRRNEEGKHFDRDLEAEVERHERADCATQ